MQTTPKFTTGQTVRVHSSRQVTSRSGARNVSAAKTMEIARVVWFDGDKWDEAGWRYHLRTPGTQGRGGQVGWTEDRITAE